MGDNSAEDLGWCFTWESNYICHNEAATVTKSQLGYHIATKRFRFGLPGQTQCMRAREAGIKQIIHFSKLFYIS